MTTPLTTGRFDDADDKHDYYITIAGTEYPVPSVTTVMGEILGQPYRATEWHMQRGRAVHACCAMIGRGIEFECDPRIEGQVEACRKFYAEINPEILTIEEAFYSSRYMFGGTVDLIIRLDEISLIIDFKAHLTKQTEIQLGGYSLLTGVRKGAGVQLNEDGTFKISDVYELKRPAQEFINLLGAYNTKARLGMLSKQEEEGEE